MQMVLQANSSLPWDRRAALANLFGVSLQQQLQQAVAQNPPQQTQDAFQVAHTAPQVGSVENMIQQLDTAATWGVMTQLPPTLFHPMHLPSSGASAFDFTRGAGRHLHQHSHLSIEALAQSAQMSTNGGALTKSKALVDSPCQTHIDALHPEMLALIFSYLDVQDKGRAAQVCVKWREAAYQKSVWRGVEAKLHLRRANPSLFPSLVTRGIKKVQVLSLKRSLRDVVQGVKNLTSLNLIGCYNLSDGWVSHAFVTEVPSLTSLNLSMCKQITDSSLGKIAQNLRNLETLDLGGCSNITNTGLLLIAWGLKKLKYLNLRSCRNIFDSGMAHLAGRTMDSANGATSLEYLCLQDCQKLTDEALSHIASGLTNLKTINLSFCASVTDSGLKHLAKMTELRELNLRSCDNISDMGLAYLAEGGSLVTTLDVSFCDKIGDQGLHHVSQGLGQLRIFGLNACPISDEGLKRISKALPELRQLLIGQCVRVTDAGLAHIADGMQRLEFIDIYGCTKVSTVGMAKVLQVKGLRMLNLGLWQNREHHDGSSTEGSSSSALRRDASPIGSGVGPPAAKRQKTLVECIKSTRPIVHHQSTATTNYLLS